MAAKSDSIQQDNQLYLSWGDLATWSPLLNLGRKASDDEVQQTLFHKYVGLHAFHGCRPIDPHNYFVEGIRAFDPDVLNTNSIGLISSQCPEIPVEEIRLAADAAPRERQPLVCGFLDSRNLQGLEFAIGGSEHVRRIIAHLPNQDQRHLANERITQLGTPALIEYRARWSVVPTFILEDLPYAIQSYLKGDRSGQPEDINLCHSQHSDVLVSDVVACYTLSSTQPPTFALARRR